MIYFIFEFRIDPSATLNTFIFDTLSFLFSMPRLDVGALVSQGLKKELSHGFRIWDQIVVHITRV